MLIKQTKKDLKNEHIIRLELDDFGKPKTLM